MYLYDGEWPRGATRVLKETRSLARNGHQVLLLARNSGSDLLREQNEWMEIVRMPGFSSRILNTALNFPVFFSPIWLAFIASWTLRWRADCLIVADLPLAPTAVWAGWMCRVPVHYDVAEVYPEFLRSRWMVDRMRMSDHLVRNPAAASLLERYVLRRAGLVFVVTDEVRDRMRLLGVRPDRIVVVGNTPEEPESLRSRSKVPDDVASLGDRPIALFVGILVADRGVLCAVEAMRLVLREVPDAALVIVGDGTERPILEKAVARLNLGDNVRLVGWKEHGELAGYYQNASVGLLPFVDSPHLQLTVANKLFDYMAAGLPVVAADVRPMRRIVTETGCGLLFSPGDIDALAKQIITLFHAPDMRNEMGLRGRDAVVSKYRWDQDEKRFLGAIETFVAGS